MILFALALIAQEAPPAASVQDAVAPYLTCIQNPKANCAQPRAKAGQDLDRVFAAQGGMSDADRHAQTESLLAAIDRQIAQMRSSGSPPESSVVTDRIDASPVFPWALRAQVGHYSQCVSDRFNALLHTTPNIREGAQVRSLFGEAKAQCADVRATATAEADAILRPGEPSAEKRAATIASALDTVDSQGETFAAAVDRAAGQAKPQ